MERVGVPRYHRVHVREYCRSTGGNNLRRVVGIYESVKISAAKNIVRNLFFVSIYFDFFGGFLHKSTDS
jgi:hypothetical protein